MFRPDQILLGLLLPLIIAGAFSLVGGWISRGNSWGATLGLIIGFILAFHSFLGRWPPLNSNEAPYGIGVAAAVVGLLSIALSPRRVPRLARGILVIAAPATLIWYSFKP